ncbi:hypothetical protein K503DRAFT_858622 [Rhizopogon vinicolor AM-OR11-026]|uniref:Uncharacterized protein n=1 Tax=Rhizopogon vinicolor AM-OR11-026 TaxID=1314800 RepID=A0A1B7MS49_9AGAM|nr:hypothetical protein K503DRAFT_858622 [Rhizopogon vinicolor AM-OR11-026]
MCRQTHPTLLFELVHYILSISSGPRASSSSSMSSFLSSSPITWSRPDQPYSTIVRRIASAGFRFLDRCLRVFSATAATSTCEDCKDCSCIRKFTLACLRRADLLRSLRCCFSTTSASLSAVALTWAILLVYMSPRVETIAMSSLLLGTPLRWVIAAACEVSGQLLGHIPLLDASKRVASRYID